MKKALVSILFAVICMTLFAQCDVDFHNTAAAHYTFSPSANGFGLEIGKTGFESKFNVHANVDLFFPRTKQYDKQNTRADFSSRIYAKFGYRVFRIEYVLSTYINGIGGMDLDRGMIYGGGLKLLHPLGKNAISVEPMYTSSGRRGEYSVQFAYHFVID